MVSLKYDGRSSACAEVRRLRLERGRLTPPPAWDWRVLHYLGARTLPGLRERILQRFLCPAACITPNHELGRPSRALVSYCA